MRARLGFVSNSSSSSFIVAFKEKPKTKEELKKILFGDLELHSIDDLSMSSSDASEIIFNDFKEPLDLNSIIDVLSEGYPNEVGRPEFPYLGPTLSQEEKQEALKKYQEKYNLYCSNIAENFKNKTEGMSYYLFEYSDEDRPHGIILEHGDTFERVPHLIVSHH